MKLNRKMKKDKCGSMCKDSCGGALYFFGFVGAAVYYISTATGFWIGVWGFIKAMIWPAFMVYELMHFLGM